MAASNASRMSKALSKIATPTVGSPKKSLRSTASPRAVVVCKKSMEGSKLPISKTRKENTTMPAVPTPTRRPPSIPLSPWNADHSEITKKSQTDTAVGGAKKKIPQLKNPPKPKALKKGITSYPASKSRSTNTEEFKCIGHKKVIPRKVSVPGLVQANIREQIKTPLTISMSQMKTSEDFKPFRQSAIVKPILSDISSLHNDSASSYSATLEVLKDEISVLGNKLHSIGYLSPSIKPLVEEDVSQVDTDIFADETQLSNINKCEEKDSKHGSLNNYKDNTKISLNNSYLPKSDEMVKPKKQKTETLLEPNYNIQGISTMQNQQKPQVTLDLESGLITDARSPRIHRRSLDGISSPRRSLPGDKPWSPYGQPLPRVFERHYDNFADAIFAPYITEDENITVMRSPRYSF